MCCHIYHLFFSNQLAPSPQEKGDAVKADDLVDLQNLPSEKLWAVPWWLVAGAIAFAIASSMISGLYPAARAARLDPVQALRYE